MRRRLQRVILPTFNPIQLRPAFWLDASRPELFFQSNAGTTAVTDGSVCGFVTDASGNGFNVTSATDGNERPSWNANGGRSYLNFSTGGTPDCLRRTSSLGMYASAEGFSLFVAMQGNTAVSQVLVGDSKSSDTDTFTGISSDSSTASTATFAHRNDGGTAFGSVNVTSVFNNTPKIFGVVDDTKTISTYHNLATTGPTNYTRSGTMTPDRFGVGAFFTTITTGHWNGFVFQIVAVLRPISPGDARRLIKWMANKMGTAL